MRFYENLHAKKIPSQAEATGKPIAEPTSLGLKKQRQENIFRLWTSPKCLAQL